MLYLLIAVFVFVGMMVWTRRRMPTRNCRWREDRAGSKGALVKYNCINCGAEAFGSTGKPNRCLSGLNKPGL